MPLLSQVKNLPCALFMAVVTRLRLTGLGADPQENHLSGRTDGCNRIVEIREIENTLFGRLQIYSSPAG